MAITTEQILELRARARDHDDYRLVAICTLALGDTDAGTPPAEPGTEEALVLGDYDLPLTGLSEDVPPDAQARAIEECTLCLEAVVMAHTPRERRTWSSPHVRDIRYLIGRDGRRRIVGRLLGSNDWVQTDDLGATLDEAVWWRLSQAAVDHADRFEDLS